MGSKLKDLAFEKRNFAPGPGNYEPVKREYIPSMKFGSGQRSELAGTKTQKLSPGPGAYDQEAAKLQKTAPKFGFGTSNREAGSKRLAVPGPGNYEPKGFVSKEGPRYSLGAQNTFHPDKKEQAFKPGPGNYSPQIDPARKREPAYRIGSETRRDLAFEKAQTFQTSPGQYDPIVENVKMKAAGWRIGTEKRPGMVNKGQEKVPGAGSYQIPSKIADGPKIGIHEKTDKVDQNVKKNVPGPGQYNLQNSPGLRNMRAPAYSLGSGTRVEPGGGKESAYKPGPGMYDSKSDTKRSAPKYGFGTMKRPEIARKSHSPAPGAYEPKAIVGRAGPALTMSPLYNDKFKARRDKERQGDPDRFGTV